MTQTSTAAKPRIRWFVYADGGPRMPHTAKMAGRWGWDATCSCGWDSRTGGATRGSVERDVRDHKRYGCLVADES